MGQRSCLRHRIDLVMGKCLDFYPELHRIRGFGKDDEQPSAIFANKSGFERLQRIAPRIPTRFNFVLLEGAWTATFRSETALAEIEAKNDFCPRVKVIRMVGGVEVLRCVVTGRELHWSYSFH